MKRIRTVALAAALAAAGAAGLAHAAPSPRIPVYTWTDAAGVTHFSDKPRVTGPQKKLLLPTPPPPDQTVLAADRAWLRELDRETQASLARAAEQRRGEAARAGQPVEYAPQQTQYVPLYAPFRRYRGHRHRARRDGDHDHDDRRGRTAQPLPDVGFPHDALPSAFPNPLAGSFPGLPTSSFPEARGGTLAPPHPG